MHCLLFTTYWTFKRNNLKMWFRALRHWKITYFMLIKYKKWFHTAHPVWSQSQKKPRDHDYIWKDGIYNRFKAEIFTFVAKLEVLICTPSEVGAEALQQGCIYCLSSRFDISGFLETWITLDELSGAILCCFFFLFFLHFETSTHLHQLLRTVLQKTSPNLSLAWVEWIINYRCTIQTVPLNYQPDNWPFTSVIIGR